MHVASTIIFEGSPPSHEEFRDHIDSRLHLVPRFRQKLRFVPFGQGRPVWVDDPHLNLDYHVRQTALPAPGSEEQLRNLAARIFSQQLDRSQAALGAVAGRGPRGRPLRDRRQEPPRAGRRRLRGRHHHRPLRPRAGARRTRRCGRRSGPPRPEPTDLELLGDALRERAHQPARRSSAASAPRCAARARCCAASARPAKMLGAGAVGARARRSTSRSGRTAGSPSSAADLGELKRVKNAHGGTVNDVILSVVAGALGNYLRARGHETEGLELRAMVPVSVRAAEEHGALGNRISAMMAPLPVWCEDPVERLRLVSETMGDLKGSGQAVGAEILTKLTDFAPTDDRLAGGPPAARPALLQPRRHQRPGPQFPLYVLGRRMESIFPMVPLARRQALCVGIMSYNGQVDFGLVGDYDAMADLDSFALDLEAAIAEIVEAAPGRPSGSESPPRRGPGTAPSQSTKCAHSPRPDRPDRRRHRRQRGEGRRVDRPGPRGRRRAGDLPRALHPRLPGRGPLPEAPLRRGQPARGRGAGRAGSTGSSPWSASPSRPPAAATSATPTTRSAVLADGAVRAVYRKNRLPNYAVFDEQRYFVPGDEPATVEVAGTRGRADDLRGRLGRRAPGLGRGRAGARADRQPLGLALPPRQGPRAGSDVRRTGARLRRPLRLLQPRRRPGRARLRRPQLRRRPRRQTSSPAPPSSRRSCWSARSRPGPADAAPSRSPTSPRSTRRWSSACATTSARTASATSASPSRAGSTRPSSRCSPPTRSAPRTSAAW